jgi:hypothetical protein
LHFSNTFSPIIDTGLFFDKATCIYC